MLDLDRAAALEGCHVAISSEAKRIPETNRLLHTELALESPQRRCGVQRPIAPCRACQAILEEHTDDRNHGQASVGNLSCQLLCLLGWIGRGQDLEAIVSWCACLVILKATRELAEAEISSDLGPAKRGNLGDSSEAIGDVGKLQACRWRQVAWQLSCDLRSDVTDGCQHADSAMIDFDGTAALEGCHVAIGGEAKRVPETNRLLHTELALESPQRRTRVQSPIAPCRASQ